MKLVFCESGKDLCERAAREAAMRLQKAIDARGEACLMADSGPDAALALEALGQCGEVDLSKVYLLGTGQEAEGADWAVSAAGSLHMAGADNMTHGGADEKERYALVLAQRTVDVALLCLGEDGALAQMGPGDGLFKDAEKVKGTGECRLAVTIPGILMAECVIACASGSGKAQAVKDMCEAIVSERCTASVLRRHKDAVLMVDREGARLIRV